MTAHWRQQIVNFCFPNGPLKIWCRPFCIFFCTFTIVMFLLVMSVDLRRQRYLPLDAVIWDFEGTPQDSPALVDIIRRNYIDSPSNLTVGNDSSSIPARQILKFFRNKREGVVIECGATPSHTEADWLVSKLDWRDLKIQPNPVDIEQLRSNNRGSSTSHSCVSSEIFTSHTHIQTSTNFPNGTLTAVPCFPLFSIMKAFDATSLDLLILDDVKMPIKILETLPVRQVTIKAISFVIQGSKNNSSDVCCADNTKELMKKWGYVKATSCPTKGESCYFTCTQPFCPNVLQQS